MSNNTINTTAGIRVMTDETVKMMEDWKAGLRDSVSTDHPMLRHSTAKLPWAHPGTMRGCSTWGEWNDHLKMPPSPDHYFVGG